MVFKFGISTNPDSIMVTVIFVAGHALMIATERHVNETDKQTTHAHTYMHRPGQLRYQAMYPAGDVVWATRHNVVGITIITLLHDKRIQLCKVPAAFVATSSLIKIGIQRVQACTR